MKLKYIEERFESYYIFGKYDDGFVDLASSSNPTIVSHISVGEANKLIQDRDDMIKCLENFSLSYPEQFNPFWNKYYL